LQLLLLLLLLLLCPQCLLHLLQAAVQLPAFLVPGLQHVRKRYAQAAQQGVLPHLGPPVQDHYCLA
jgi:hypothetical protein